MKKVLLMKQTYNFILILFPQPANVSNLSSIIIYKYDILRI